MPRSNTTIHHCAFCRVVEVSPSERAICPLCNGLMLKGAPPHGIYAPLTEDGVHEAYAVMMSSNGGVR